MADSTASRISQNLSSCRKTDGLLAQLREQFDQGETAATLPFTSIASLGQDGLRHLVQRVEADLLTKFTVEVNMVTNNARFTPTVPSSEPSSPASTTSTTNTTSNKPIVTSKKVPRPANAFIIYRRDWHARTVAKNPGLHNNKISRIIGDKWRDESQKVKDDYAKKAADLKKQHLINNPGYHYQPRKPHEKKRRMTKRKIAALAAQKKSSTTTAATSEEQITQTPGPNAVDVAQVSCPTIHLSPPGNLMFAAGPDPNNVLAGACGDINDARDIIMGHPAPVNQYLTEPVTSVEAMADESLVLNEFDFTSLVVDIGSQGTAEAATGERRLIDAGSVGFNLNATNGPLSNITVPRPGLDSGETLSSLPMYYAQDMTEYDRQTDFAQADELGTLFDFDAFGEGTSTDPQNTISIDQQNMISDGAENAINQLEANYIMPNIDGDFNMDDAALTHILGVPTHDGMIIPQINDNDPFYAGLQRDAYMPNSAGDYAADGL